MDPILKELNKQYSFKKARKVYPLYALILKKNNPMQGINTIVKEGIQDIAAKCLREAGNTDGDIDPLMQEKLDAISGKLADLMRLLVNINL
jgi:hypothetical protein